MKFCMVTNIYASRPLQPLKYWNFLKINDDGWAPLWKWLNAISSQLFNLGLFWWDLVYKQCT